MKWHDIVTKWLMIGFGLVILWFLAVDEIKDFHFTFSASKRGFFDGFFDSWIPPVLALILIIVVGLTAMKFFGRWLLETGLDIYYPLMDARDRWILSQKGKREAEIITVKTHGDVAISDKYGSWTTIKKMKNAAKQITASKQPALAEPELLPPPDNRDLFQVLNPLQRVLVIGAQGSGKSTLLKWLLKDRLEQGYHCIICDPHVSPGDYPDAVQIAGAGQNWAEIEGAMAFVQQEQKRRYEELAKRKQKFTPLVLVVDELFATTLQIELEPYFKSFLAEGRKAGIELLCFGHSDRAGATGTSGNKDLLTGYQAIAYLHREGERRYGLVHGLKKKKDARTGKLQALVGEHEHPGVFPGFGRYENSISLPQLEAPKSGLDRFFELYAADEAARLSGKAFYDAYELFSYAREEDTISMREFGIEAKKRFETVNSNGRVFYKSVLQSRG